MAIEREADGVTQLLRASALCIRALVGLSPRRARIVLRFVEGLIGGSDG